MSLIVVLLVLAFGLMVVELFVPGGVLALLAFVLFLVAAVLGAVEYGLPVGISIFVIGLLLCCLLLIGEVFLLRQGPVANMITHTGQNRATAVTTGAENENLVGSEGMTVSALYPTGKVKIRGKIYQASAPGEYLDAGEQIRVVRVDGFQIIVQKQ